MAALSQVHLLYIEDEQPLCALFKLAMEAKGYAVDIAPTGQQGLEKYQSKKHDVVAVDYQLTDMTGIDVGRKLLEITPSLPVLLVTGEGSEQLAVQAFTMGFSNYVVKGDASVYLELIPSIVHALMKSVHETRQRIDAETRLADKEHQLRSIFENTATGVISIDDGGAITMANPAALRLFGYTEQEFIGANISILSPSPDKLKPGESVKELLASIDDGSIGVGKDVFRQHKNGTLFPVQLVLSKAEISGNTFYTGVITDLSERINAERTRRLLEQGLENIDQALALYDKNDILVFCNRKYTLDHQGKVRPNIVPGVSFEETVYSAVASAMFKAPKTSKKKFVRSILEFHHRSDASYDLETSNGRWLNYREFKTMDDSWVLLRQDITDQKLAHQRTLLQNEELERRVQLRTDELVEKIEDQKRVEDALRSSESRVRTLLESVNDGIFTINEDNVIESFNSCALQMFGYSLDEILGKKLPDLIATPEYAERRKKSRSETSDRRKNTLNRRYQEIRAIHKNGTIFPVELSLNELDIGVKQRFVGTVRDLTERRAEEMARREIEARFRSVVDSSPSAILIKNLSGRVLSANAQWNKWFNPQNHELADLNLHTLFDKPHAELLKNSETLVSRTGETVAFEMQTPLADGKILSSLIQVFPVIDQDDAVTAVGVMNTDISERVQAEEDRRQALDQVEKANRAKSEFLAAMSHELRTPLNAILGFSQIIASQYMGPIQQSKYVDYAEDICRSSNHLLSLVNNILDLSAVEAGGKSIHKQQTRLFDIIDECRRNMIVTTETRNIDLSVSYFPDDTAQVFVDQRCLKQIVLNLLSNAVQATPDRGTISVENHLSDNQYTLTVCDTGHGIAADKLQSLTLPFVRGETDPHLAQGGAGLGLSIVKSLIDLHHGQLKISSEVGSGTTVSVILPVDHP